MKIPAALSGPFMAVVLCLVCTHMRSQDSLFYANGNIVLGQVEEVGLDQIRYRTNSAGNTVLIAVDKHELSRVKLQGGQEYVFDGAIGERPFSAAFLHRKREVSFDVLAPALEHITVGYEQAFGKHMGLVVKAGYIGLWETERYDDTFNSKGGLLSAGVKFMLPYSAKRIPSVREQHPLSGWYLRPEVVFSAWTHTRYYYDYYYSDPAKFKTDFTSAALILTVGRQILLGERFTFDISGGFGYGAQWENGQPTNDLRGSNSRQNYSFSHAFLGNVSPLVVSGGLRFGYVF